LTGGSIDARGKIVKLSKYDGVFHDAETYSNNVQRKNRMDNLYHVLETKISEMEGDWVVPKNAYESSFCNLLGWQCVNHRYYDAITTDGLKVELKKGQGSMWYDMVRYAEIFLGVGDQETITVFLRWNKKKKKVTEIYVIDTVEILKFLKMDHQKAHTCILFKEEAYRGLNMLASMTALDMRNLASKKIYNPTEAALKKPSKNTQIKQPVPFQPLLNEGDSTAGELWTVAVSKTLGKPYWFDKITKKTMWTNPDRKSEWRPILSKSVGKTYWYNEGTKCSSWVRPLESSDMPM